MQSIPSDSNRSSSDSGGFRYSSRNNWLVCRNFEIKFNYAAEFKESDGIPIGVLLQLNVRIPIGVAKNSGRNPAESKKLFSQIF